MYIYIYKHVLYYAAAKDALKRAGRAAARGANIIKHQYLTGIIGNIVLLSSVFHKRKKLLWKLSAIWTQLHEA